LSISQRALTEQRANLDELKQALKSLDAKLKDVKLRKESIKQRARAAKAGDAPNQLSGQKAFDKFDQLEGRISAMEEMQELTNEMEGRDAATAAKFASLEDDGRDPKIEDDLAALKRKLEQGQ
jgi:phage shock protein A